MRLLSVPKLNVQHYKKGQKTIRASLLSKSLRKAKCQPCKNPSHFRVNDVEEENWVDSMSQHYFIFMAADQ